MAATSYGVNDALAVKLWAKQLAAEALKATPIAPLIGSTSDSIIQMKEELSKGPGDKVTFGLRTQLTGDGVSEGETLEGNEESLATYSDALVINELRHAVRVRTPKRIDAKRVPFNLRNEAKMGLVDWFAKRMSVSFFNQVGGNTAQTLLKYTGFQTATAPSSNRRVACNATTTTADASLSSSDKFKLIYLDYAKELAMMGASSGSGPALAPIRPINIGGEDKFVCYLHPYQVTDLRTDATTAGNWYDIQKAALTGGQISKNPIYNGALGEYNSVILRVSPDVPTGVNAGTGAAISTVRRAVFMGAQAAVCAFAGQNDSETFDWVEELFDYEGELGISVQTMFGIKKTVFSSTDFGVITLPSYAAAHA